MSSITSNSAQVQPRLAKRVALLTNFMLPDRLALMRSFAPRVGRLRVFLSAKTGAENGGEGFNSGDLEIVQQKSLRWTYRFRHVSGYQDETEIQVPIDTLYRLWQYRPEVMITGEFGGRTLFAILYRILRPDTKLVLWATLSQRTEATRGRLRQTLRRWILTHVDAAFVNAEDGERYLRSLGFRGPASVIPYVVDAGEFAGSSVEVNDDVVRLLYAGQLIERKGLTLFLAALCKWCATHAARSVELRIAGAGPERERLGRQVLPTNLSVTFLGQLNRPELRKAYCTASIYAFPTLGDEWGLVVNEALSAGTPVLGSCHSLAVSQLVREGFNGWLFDPSEPESLLSGIDRALSTGEQELKRISANARQSVADLTPEVVAKQMVDELVKVTQC